ncbi:MAG: hypothetical protein GWP91_11700 [Rhodobacterales bacterium]|nr:hypothetical protein [Rhodobacterales bacterium]
MSRSELFTQGCGGLVSVEIQIGASPVDVQQVTVLHVACAAVDAGSCKYLQGAADKCAAGNDVKTSEHSRAIAADTGLLATVTA